MKDATYITVLLDRSGSMGSIKEETISGYNFFLKEQQDVPGDCNLTLVQFDTAAVDTVYENTPIKEVKPLDNNTYQPRGGTPLLDALGRTIVRTGEILKSIPEGNRPDKILFVILTDGQENSSREYTKSRIKEMIEHQTSVYKWNFTYLGANQDAFSEAAHIGISKSMAANFAAGAVADSLGVMSTNSARYRASGQSADLHYSDAQRVKMMDEKLELRKKQKGK